MTHREDYLNLAFTAGVRAHADETRYRVPMLDPVVHAALEEHHPVVGDPWTRELFQSFILGWDQAAAARTSIRETGRCSFCRCGVNAEHVPDGQDCRELQEERRLKHKVGDE